MRTSWAQGHPNHGTPRRLRGGPQGRALPGLPPHRPVRGPQGQRPPATGWSRSGTACRSSRRSGPPGPKVVLMHHVHADMWHMVLPPNLATMGDTLERRVAPLDLPAQPDDHPVAVVHGRRCSRSASRPATSRSSRPASTPASRRAASAPPTPTVLAAGRLVPVKRYDLLIRAVVEARRPVPDLDAHHRRHRPAAGRARGAGRRRSTPRDAVRFAGWVSDDELLDLYRRSWLVASASVREGWGMTLTEAAACATPAVATRIAGHTDAVVDGRQRPAGRRRAGPRRRHRRGRIGRRAA